MQVGDGQEEVTFCSEEHRGPGVANMAGTGGSSKTQNMEEFKILTGFHCHFLLDL
jgi:hypothetical protein